MHIFEMAREAAVIRSIASTLGWDQETYMPDAAAPHRASQISWLSSRCHELATSDAWEKALDEALSSDDGSDATTTANLKWIRHEFDRDQKLTADLVKRASEATSLAKHAWAEARQNDDFGAFAPHLEVLLEIAKEKAELWGYEDEPYDALLETYERGAVTRDVAVLFDSVESELRELAAAAVEKSRSNAVTLPPGPYPVAAQQAFNKIIAEAMGLDFAAARIDTTTHPFCTNLGPGDQRLTTRYYENDFTSSLFGVLHEAGHGLYEMGLPKEDFGLPSGSSLSLGIHESQSRLWENHVGRSQAFWEKWYPTAQEHFPQLADFPFQDFLQYVQRASYTAIRVEADEATYDLHILLRFDMERRMLKGEIPVKDIPEAWNTGFEDRFGFRPDNNTQGCLQDIHWSMGGLGYFSTYSLGNFNAAQIYKAARQDSAVANGCDQADYLPLLGWMREKIHTQGAVNLPAELIESATGEAPSTAPYLEHLRCRYL